MLLHKHFTQQLLHLSEQRVALPFAGVVVAIFISTAHCARFATSTQFKPELNNSPFTET
jgi:hypothetical protein